MSIKRDSLSDQGKVTKIHVLVMLQCKYKHQAYHHHHHHDHQQPMFYMSTRLGLSQKLKENEMPGRIFVVMKQWGIKDIL